jgi:MFS family permease
MPKESLEPLSPSTGEVPSAPVSAPAAAPSLQTVTTPKQRRRAFALLFLSLMCLGMGQTIIFSVLPGIARQRFGLSEFETNMIFSLSSILWMLGSPFWGRRSEVWGRRPVILIGMAGFSSSILLLALSMDLGLLSWAPIGVAYGLMIVSRAIYGLLGPGAQSGSQAYVVDRTPREQRTAAISGLSAAWGIGTVLGPGIGASLVVFGLIAPFLLLAAFGFSCVLGIWFLLPERTPPKEHRAPPVIHATDRRIAVFVIFGVVSATVQAIPLQTFGFYMTDLLHLDPSQAAQFVGVGLMASAMAGLFAQLVLVQRFHLSAATLTWVGLVLALISCVLLATSRQYGPLVTALVFNGLGFGMCRPGITAAASLSVKPGEQGAVAGVMVATGGAAFILCTLTAVPLYPLLHQAPYILGAVLISVLLVLFFVLPDFKRDLTSLPEDPDIDVGVSRG